MAFELKDIAKLKWYYQVLIVAGVCGGLLAGFWYQYLTPINDDIQNRMKTLTDLQGVIAKSLQQQKQLAQIKKDAQDRSAAGKRNGSDFPLRAATSDDLRFENSPGGAASVD